MIQPNTVPVASAMFPQCPCHLNRPLSTLSRVDGRWQDVHLRLRLHRPVLVRLKLESMQNDQERLILCALRADNQKYTGETLVELGELLMLATASESNQKDMRELYVTLERLMVKLAFLQVWSFREDFMVWGRTMAL
jgi:hypothetical protein